MVLPLLALAGVGGLMSAGSTMLGNYLQGQRAQEQQRRLNAAMQAGMVGPQTVEAPRQDPGFVGPGAPMQQPGYFDPQLMAMELVRQGDPQGLAMLAQQSQQQQGFENQQALQTARFQNQWDQMLWQQANQPQQPMMDVDGRQVPYEPIVMGTPEWMKLEREQAGMSRIYDIMNEYRNVLQTSGSESVGRTAQKLGALRAELINARALASEAGALQEAEIEFYGSMVPDPTRWTPEFMTQEVGKLEALGDWYNAQARSFANRQRFAMGLDPLPLFPTESLVPSDWRPVDESDIGQDPRLEREGAGQQVSVPTLDELIARAQGGGYVSPAEWRGQ